MIELASPAQCVGYLAFALGVAAFLQKGDGRLKLLVACECLAYALHFVLLGNASASASALVSCARYLLALRTRSRWVAAAIVTVHVVLGATLATGGTGWLPVVASCTGTLAVFTMSGIRMRLTLLATTLLWLANNVLCRSIGGTVLECTVAVVNVSTMIRVLASAPPAERATG